MPIELDEDVVSKAKADEKSRLLHPLFQVALLSAAICTSLAIGTFAGLVFAQLLTERFVEAANQKNPTEYFDEDCLSIEEFNWATFAFFSGFALTSLASCAMIIMLACKCRLLYFPRLFQTKTLW